MSIINFFTQIDTVSINPANYLLNKINLTLFDGVGLPENGPLNLKGNGSFGQKITYFNINPQIILRDGIVDNTMPSTTKKIEYYFLAKHKTNSTYIQWKQTDNDTPNAADAGVNLSDYFDPDVIFTKEIVE
jgi:hypothetical protein